LYQILSLVPPARAGHCQGSGGHEILFLHGLNLNCIKFSPWSRQQEQGIVSEAVGMKYYSWIVLILYQIPSLVAAARAGHCQGSGGHEILLKDCT
jgi:hypothetical protein